MRRSYMDSYRKDCGLISCKVRLSYVNDVTPTLLNSCIPSETVVRSLSEPRNRYLVVEEVSTQLPARNLHREGDRSGRKGH